MLHGNRLANRRAQFTNNSRGKAQHESGFSKIVINSGFFSGLTSEHLLSRARHVLVNEY